MLTKKIRTSDCALTANTRKGFPQFFAVRQIQEITQSNASGSEETASTAEELNSQAESLKLTVDNLMKLVTRNAAEKYES